MFRLTERVLKDEMFPLAPEMLRELVAPVKTLSGTETAIVPEEAVLISAGPVEVNESVEPAGAHAIDGVAEKFVIDGSGFTFTDTVAVVEHPLFAPPELSVAVTT